MTDDERTAVQAAHEIAGITAEAAELLEHISETEPLWKREELLTQAINMIDDAHGIAVETHLDLQDDD